MNTTFLAGLFLALTFFSAGLAIGGYFFSFRKAKDPRPAPPPPEAVPAPGALPETELPLSVPPARPVNHPDLQEVVRLFRHAPSGKLLADFGGKVRAAGQALSSEQHTTLTLAAADLAEWLETPSLPRPVAGAPLGGPATATPPPPSANPMEAWRALNAQRAQPGTPAPTSLAGRIDVVLQELLALSELRGADIEMRDAPGGGAAFYVHGRSYEFMDQIPDPAVQALFQQAIREWERRNADE